MDSSTRFTFSASFSILSEGLTVLHLGISVLRFSCTAFVRTKASYILSLSACIANKVMRFIVTIAITKTPK